MEGQEEQAVLGRLVEEPPQTHEPCDPFSAEWFATRLTLALGAREQAAEILDEVLQEPAP